MNWQVGKINCWWLEQQQKSFQKLFNIRVKKKVKYFYLGYMKTTGWEVLISF